MNWTILEHTNSEWSAAILESGLRIEIAQQTNHNNIILIFLTMEKEKIDVNLLHMFAKYLFKRIDGAVFFLMASPMDLFLYI